MKLSDKTYNFLKWLCLIAVPALITLISALGSIYGHDMTIVTATIGAVATFIGSLIGISNSNYKKDNENDSGTDQ